jgi:hypothetical protein
MLYHMCRRHTNKQIHLRVLSNCNGETVLFNKYFPKLLKGYTDACRMLAFYRTIIH